MQELTLQTDRKTQLVDIPRQLRPARAQGVRHGLAITPAQQSLHYFRSMRRAIVFTVLLGAVAASAAGAARKEAPPGIHLIDHVVVIMQENRSFDSYFGTYPGADGIPKDVCVPDPAGAECVRPYRDTADRNAGGPHDHRNAVGDIAGGTMDGFVGQ